MKFKISLLYKKRAKDVQSKVYIRKNTGIVNWSYSTYSIILDYLRIGLDAEDAVSLYVRHEWHTQHWMNHESTGQVRMSYICNNECLSVNTNVACRILVCGRINLCSDVRALCLYKQRSLFEMWNWVNKEKYRFYIMVNYGILTVLIVSAKITVCYFCTLRPLNR